MGAASQLSPAIHCANRGAAIPLSFAQERLWIIDRLSPATPRTISPSFFEIYGSIDVARLQRAIDAVVERHEIFASRLPAAELQASQKILPEMAVPFITMDALEDGEDLDFLARVRKRLSAESTVALSLESGPLLKFFYFPHRDGHGCLGLVIHHAIFDGWSISVLLNDLSASYIHDRRGTRQGLAIQYANYSVWQRNGTGTANYTRQLAYWKEQLAGPLPVLEFPTDFTRPPRQTWCGKVSPRSFRWGWSSRRRWLSLPASTARRSSR